MSTIAMPVGPRGVAADSFRNCIFRANPDYEFVLLDQLPTEEQKMLSDLRGDPDFYGLLRPRLVKGLTTKAVSREIAKLVDVLKEPGSLPTFVANDPEFELAISRLVCDGILQITHGAEWICGPAAWQAGHSVHHEKSGGLLAELSIQALQHAESLECSDAVELSALLYRYNTLPLTPQWLRRIPNGAALEEYLQIQSGDCRRDLDRGWTRVSILSERSGSASPWLAWNSRTILGSQTNRAGYKLYLSPLPAHLREAFRVWLPAIAAAGAHDFKIGSNVRGLLRPDKMVAYFDNLPALQEAAQRITTELKGCPAQGVPFTVELECGALISWGSDPPLEEAVPVWLRRQSWRQWICNRLGSALAVAKREKARRREDRRKEGDREGVVDMAAWRFGLERLRLEGVDIATWTPISTIWKAKPGLRF